MPVGVALTGPVPSEKAKVVVAAADILSTLSVYVTLRSYELAWDCT